MSNTCEKDDHVQLSVSNRNGVFGLSLSHSMDFVTDCGEQSVKSGVTDNCMCKPAVYHTTCIIYCAGCNKPTQISYLLQKFRQAGGSSNKYNHEWQTIS